MLKRVGNRVAKVLGKTLRVLSVDDWEDETLLVVRALSRAGYTPIYERVDTREAMEAALDRQAWDVVICDHAMPCFSSFGALDLLKEKGLDLPFIVLSARIGEDMAVQLMKAGAHDYVMKDNQLRLVPVIERELREAEVRSERRHAEAALRESEARLKSMTANVPGMVFQILRSSGGTWSFPYASEGSVKVCALPRETIQAAPSAFSDLIHPQDRDSFWRSLERSAQTLANWDWEGRLVLDSQGLKWINCRASIRQTGDGNVLWDGIIFNITESKEREQQVNESRELLRELSAHRESAREEERKRIAREIHDELGQVLTALKMDLAYLNMNFGEPQPRLQATVKSMGSLIDRAVESVRSIATALRPGVLDLGLVAAIEWQAQEFQARTGIPCELHVAEQEIMLDDSRATAIFRILQESLTNVARHAEATWVKIGLEKTEGLIELRVEDNGKGVILDRVNKAKSFGLVGIKERTAILGGTLDIRSGSGKGTTLSVSVPL